MAKSGFDDLKANDATPPIVVIEGVRSALLVIAPVFGCHNLLCRSNGRASGHGRCTLVQDDWTTIAHFGKVRTDMTQRGGTQRWVLQRVLTFVAVVALSWLLYLILGNSVLRDRLEAASEAAGLSLEVASARTLVPGLFVLKEVRLEDAASGWSVSARRAECSLDLTTLFSDTIRIRRLTAEAVVTDIAEAPTVAQGQAKLGQTLPPTASLAMLASAGHSAAPQGARTLLVEHVEASGKRLTVGSHTIRGRLRYELSGVSIHRAGAEASIAVQVSDGALSRRGQWGATLSGRVQAAIVVDPEKPGVWQRARGSVDLAGKLTSLAPWTGLKPPAVELNDATHELQFEFRAGQVHSGTATLAARSASLQHADQSHTRLAEGIRVTMTVDPQQDPPTRVEFRAGTLQLIDSKGAPWAGLSKVRLLARLPATNDAIEAPTGKLEVHTESARISVLRSTISGSVEATTSIKRFELGRGRLLLGTGKLSAENALLNANAAPGTPHRINAELEVESAHLDIASGLEFSGDLRVEGDDAGMFLDMADASETVRWTLSLLETQPFTIQANLTEQHDSLTLKDLHLETTTLTARGAAYKSEHETRGAFLVQGPLPIGVSLHSGGIAAEAPVGAHWLRERESELLAEP